MKFPITRDTLQTIDIVKEQKHRYDIAIQHHINSLVHKICQELENSILWEKPKNISYTTDITDRLEYKQQKIINDKRFIWEGLRYITKSTINSSTIDAPESVLIALLIEKLKETFIGCEIIFDPLKTYLIIDWS